MSTESVHSEHHHHDGAAPPCPGAPMKLAFDNLTPGQGYTVSLDAGLTFTGASSETDNLPGGVTFAGDDASFTAPMATVQFGLGVVVSKEEVSILTDLTGSETVKISLLGGGGTGVGGPIKFNAVAELPPTCIVLNPNTPACPVCAMDVSKCPEASKISNSQFCVGQHIFLCCLECPGDPSPIVAH